MWLVFLQVLYFPHASRYSARALRSFVAISELHDESSQPPTMQPVPSVGLDWTWNKRPAKEEVIIFRA
jgi:hypothetical protein